MEARSFDAVKLLLEFGASLRQSVYFREVDSNDGHGSEKMLIKHDLIRNLGPKTPFLIQKTQVSDTARFYWCNLMADLTIVLLETYIYIYM